MSRNIAWGWAAALTVSLMGADLPAQEGEARHRLRAGHRGSASGPNGRGARAIPRLQRGDPGCREGRRVVHPSQEGGPSLRRDPARSVQPAAARAGDDRAGIWPWPGVPVGDDETVFIFRRVGDRIQLVRRNIHFKAPAARRSTSRSGRTTPTRS